MTIYGYIRVSGLTQAHDGYGLKIQKDDIISYCKKEQLVLDCLFADEGISGTDLERPGLSELLQKITKDDVLIVRSIDRLWRDDINRIMVTEELRKSGVKLISLQEPAFSLNDTQPSDYLIRSLISSLAVYSKMEIVNKLKSGRKKRMASGLPGGSITPFGYRCTERGLAIEPANAEKLNKVFRMRASGKTLRECSNILEKSISQVSRILSNPIYYQGYMIYDKTRIKCPPIVSRYIWQKAQKNQSVSTTV